MDWEFPRQFPDTAPKRQIANFGSWSQKRQQLGSFHIELILFSSEFCNKNPVDWGQTERQSDKSGCRTGIMLENLRPIQIVCCLIHGGDIADLSGDNSAHAAATKRLSILENGRRIS